jgi:hypothetical protein
MLIKKLVKKKDLEEKILNLKRIFNAPTIIAKKLIAMMKAYKYILKLNIMEGKKAKE